MKLIPGIAHTDLSYPYNLLKIRYLLISYMCFPEDSTLRDNYLQEVLQQLVLDHVLYTLEEQPAWKRDLDSQVRIAGRLFGLSDRPIAAGIRHSFNNRLAYYVCEEQWRREFPVVAKLVYKFIQLNKFYSTIKRGASLEKVIGLLDSAPAQEKGEVKNAKYMKSIWRKYKQVAHIIFAYTVTQVNDHHLHEPNQDVHFLYRAFLAQNFLLNLKIHGGKLYSDNHKMWLIPKMQATGELAKLQIDAVQPLTEREEAWLHNYHNDSQGFNSLKD